MILVSGCLAGIKCKYHGGDNLIELVAELVAKGLAIPVCPEELGGLPTPREAVDIEKGTGINALAGQARLISESGSDVTTQFIEGAKKVLQIAQEHNVKLAVLKERSPSCGSTRIYNRIPNCSSAVERELVEGMGVTAALLILNGIKVMSEENLTEQAINKMLGLDN